MNAEVNELSVVYYKKKKENKTKMDRRMSARDKRSILLIG